MRVVVHPSVIAGEAAAPPSKSYTHRAIVCGLLSNGSSTISNPLYCDDTKATMRICEMMGADIQQDTTIRIKGPNQLKAPASEMDCKGSGTTLRIFCALSALVDGKCVLTGDITLRQRPIGPLVSALRQLGVNTRFLGKAGRPPVQILGRGFIKGGKVTVPGNISSQYITALLFACSKARESTTIRIEGNLESQPYVRMSLAIMDQFGVKTRVSNDWNQILVPGNQSYQSRHYEVEGDYSSASFLLAAGALAGDVAVSGLRRRTLQGDAKFLRIIQKMGACVRFASDVSVKKDDMNGVIVDVSNVPDLVPILAVIATQANGTTRIVNAARLRLKESDRLASISQELRKMGGDIEQVEDGMTIRGPSRLRGRILDSHRDHRIAMAGIVAGLVADDTTVVRDVECIKKSYPSFISDIRSIGGRVELIHDNGIGG
ncbi:MAG: 3-phosphoshikimate 1-carboxyvinyltransferase [Candidatus Lokiarchaeota archaeon]|nr:3-phosphoshikimate 1-carboxyvinyltransferase [Candidatus Lokiarchaeota archaeon]